MSGWLGEGVDIVLHSVLVFWHRCGGAGWLVVERVWGREGGRGEGRREEEKGKGKKERARKRVG